jgi:hypothetical protein
MRKKGKILTGKSEIWIDEEGILRLSPVDGVEIDLEEVKTCFEHYDRLGFKEKKALQLIDGRVSITFTSEARDYTAKHAREFFIASAVISSSLPVRLLINFFKSFYKDVVPLRLFRTEEEALRWLRSFRKG